MRRSILVLAVLAAVLAACGGTDGSGGSTTTAPAESAPTTTTAAPDAPTSSPGTEASSPVSFAAADGTEARFVIDEVLRGNDETVVAVNEQVEVAVVADFGAGTVDVGPVTIDAASFVTDEDRRNGVIDRFILDTASHPTITFTPTDTSGLTVDGGTIVGDLTIRGVTNPVTFDVTVDGASAEGITAFAGATVDRTDWDLNIPNVPFVASVAEEVTLELDLVLAPAG
jgi:polyisoprenoid-binding protein YceI